MGRRFTAAPWGGGKLTLSCPLDGGLDTGGVDVGSACGTVDGGVAFGTLAEFGTGAWPLGRVTAGAANWAIAAIAGQQNSSASVAQRSAPRISGGRDTARNAVPASIDALR